MPCIFCKTAETLKSADGKRNICPNCGTVETVNIFAELIYGRQWKDRVSIDLFISEKYIITHIVPGQKGATAAFGLIGMIVATAVDKQEKFGYFDRNEIREIIHPYRNSRIKDGDCAMKVVHVDGTDFIIRGKGTSLSGLVRRLKELGYPVTDGSTSYFGDRLCDHPFLQKDTVDSWICASAVPFIKLRPGIVAAVPKNGTVPPPKQTSAAAQPPRPQSTPAQSRQAPVKPAPAQTAAPASTGGTYKFCHECGSKLQATDKFCVSCGTRQR